MGKDPEQLEWSDLELLRAASEGYQKLKAQIGTVIIGQERIVRMLLGAIFCQGHVLIIGVPGLAKTMLVKTLAQALGWTFKRIQFTPDMMPADIIGMELLQEDRATGSRGWRFMRGPVFANIILADEINRTPPKTQSALLEAMQEYTVTSMGKSYELEQPFIVVATQNPIEQEGTYPLPEAQLDRFMFMILVDYPSSEEETQIMKQVTSAYEAELEVALTGEEILRLQEIVRRVPVAEHVYDYAKALARSSRPASNEAADFVHELVNWGAGPRASIYMILAGKARAILHGRYHVTTEDIQEMALPVLRHRIITTFNAEAAGITSDEIVRRLLAETREKVPAVE
jgi:MoxR-like ATPase